MLKRLMCQVLKSSWIKYNYTILKSSATDKLNGAPVFNVKGQVIGLFNSAGESQSSTDVNYAKDFVVKRTFTE